MGILREVVEADLPVFYEHQRDREAAAMAAFPPRERDAFMAHWAKTLANESALTWTVVCDGAVAGNIGCWEDDGRRLVGYWIGREFWGRGLATQALAEVLDVVDARPLHAYVAKSNVPRSACSRSAGSSRLASTRATTGSRSSSWSCGHETDLSLGLRGSGRDLPERAGMTLEGDATARYRRR